MMNDIILRKRPNENGWKGNESPFKTLSFSFSTVSNGLLLMIWREFEISRTGQKVGF